ncbi:hypothetical protein GCM10022224_067370 [Nonomuraea antimicrobica]|uniref:Uncharacterized protein n=2 Tax=Nonomuraea antimicrobica TaxID=561173 RepID=A0ABP7CKW3_9ACTN
MTGDESLRDLFNDSLEVMSVCDYERLGAEPAVETCGSRPRSRPIGLPDGAPAPVGASCSARRTVPGELTGVAA